MSLHKELLAAAKAGDGARIRELMGQLKANGQFNSFLKGAMLFSGSEDSVTPNVAYLMPYLDHNICLSGGPLLGNVAYHTGLVGDLGNQQMAICFLLMRGADPNATFTPTEHMEGAKPLSAFNMLITSQIGKPIIGMHLRSILDWMLNRLNLDATEDEPSKLEQIVTALHPFNLLQTRFQKGIAEEERWKYTINPFDDSPPFDLRQQRQAEQIIESLVKAGADLSSPIERAPEHHFNNGLPLIEALRGYCMIIDTALQDPEQFEANLRQKLPQGWDKPEFDFSERHLKAAKIFYHQLFERAKEIYLDAKDIDRPRGRERDF